MSYASLHEYLDNLARDGSLVRVSSPVDPELEIPEIARRAEGQGGPAIQFENVKGSTADVVCGIYSSEQRICRALGLDSIDQLAERIAAAIDQHRRSWYDCLSGGASDDSLDRFRPKPIKNSACQQVLHLGSDVDLRDWPALKSWPEEASRSFTGACVISQHPETGFRAIERLSLSVQGAAELALSWHPYGPIATHFVEASRRGERLPIAVALGAPPALTLASEIVTPPDVETYTLAGLLRDIPIEVVRCRSHDLEVPAEAEVVIEGYVDPDESTLDAGQFAARTGFLLSNSEARRLHVTALSHRNEPIVPAMLMASKSPDTSEGNLIGEVGAISKMLERLAAPRLRSTLPEVVELCLPSAAPCGSMAIVSIDKSRPHQARQVAGAIWAMPELMNTRIVLIVDAKVDVFDWPQVVTQLALHVHPERDLFIQDGPTALWDHASKGWPSGHKLGIDATRKMPNEQAAAIRSASVPQASQAIFDQVTQRWDEYGIGSSE